MAPVAISPGATHLGGTHRPFQATHRPLALVTTPRPKVPPDDMAPRLRKFALSTHLTFSVGWIGAVVAYLALGIATRTSQDVQTVRAALIAMEVTVRFVIVPLALASLLTGLVMVLANKWAACSGTTGSYSHSCSSSLPPSCCSRRCSPISAIADLAREADAATVERTGGDLLHPGLGLVVLS